MSNEIPKSNPEQPGSGETNTQWDSLTNLGPMPSTEIGDLTPTPATEAPAETEPSTVEEDADAELANMVYSNRAEHIDDPSYPKVFWQNDSQLNITVNGETQILTPDEALQQFGDNPYFMAEYKNLVSTANHRQSEAEREPEGPEEPDDEREPEESEPEKPDEDFFEGSDEEFFEGSDEEISTSSETGDTMISGDQDITIVD